MKKEIEPIIVRLNSLEVKRALIINSKRLKLNGQDLGMGSQPIFVDEHLCALMVEILKEAKRAGDLGQFKFVWCREGKVYVCESEGQTRRRIASVQDLRPTCSKKRNVDTRKSRRQCS